MFKKIIFIIPLVFFFYNNAAASNYVGVGLHVGAHLDVGNVSESSNTLETDPQNNSILGGCVKFNMAFLFLRFGADTTFLMNRGEKDEDFSGTNEKIEYYRIHYTALPVFFGFNFPIYGIGDFYLGTGFVYFLGSGKVKTELESEAEEIKTSALGYGILSGIQLNVTASVKLYFEWEYIDARSDPIIKSQDSYDWKNFYVDFSGNRFFMGVMYYLL